VLVREEDEGHRLNARMPLELFDRRRKRHLGRPFDRIAVDTRRDRGERDGAATELLRDLQHSAVTRGEELGLSLIAALPDGPDRVDHVARRKLAGRRRLRVAGLAAAEPPALLEDRGTAGSMDCAVDPASAEE